MNCDCNSWKENIDKIDSPITLQAIRTSSSGYNGEQFHYCPWCGKELKEKE